MVRQGLDLHLSHHIGWKEHTKIVAPDREMGDRFGRVVVLSADQILVSSEYDTAKPRTTWLALIHLNCFVSVSYRDFETGDLRGWTAVGEAFINQPTLG